VLHGHLTVEELHNLMRSALYGVISYPVNYVAKSGVFASYCAHGVCPILYSDRYEAADGLIADKHYLAQLPISADSAEEVGIRVGRAAWNWYQGHSVKNHVETLLKLMPK
jgi:hypothetical protein